MEYNINKELFRQNKNMLDGFVFHREVENYFIVKLAAPHSEIKKWLKMNKL